MAIGALATAALAFAALSTSGAWAAARHCGSLTIRGDAGQIEASHIVGHHVKCHRARTVVHGWAQTNPPAGWKCGAHGTAGPDHAQPIECRRHHKRVDFDAGRSGLMTTQPANTRS